jgi:hypothetical protein
MGDVPHKLIYKLVKMIDRSLQGPNGPDGIAFWAQIWVISKVLLLVHRTGIPKYPSRQLDILYKIQGDQLTLLDVSKSSIILLPFTS